MKVLKEQLKNYQVLNPNDSANLMGGRRFKTMSRAKFRRKKRKLKAKNVHFTTMVGDGHYCIEW